MFGAIAQRKNMFLLLSAYLNETIYSLTSRRAHRIKHGVHLLPPVVQNVQVVILTGEFKASS